MMTLLTLLSLLLSAVVVYSADVNSTQALPDVSNHTKLHLLPSECGTYVADDRIYGGTNASLFEFPWMALLYYKTKRGNEFQCGGTIINEKYILTAAHCLTGPKVIYSLIGVRIGEHVVSTFEDCEEYDNMTRCAPPVQDLTIQEIIPHEHYNFTTHAHDIGLIRVQTMNLTLDNAQPICLPLDEEQNANITDKYVTVTGFGLTEKRKASQMLLKVSLPAISNDDCSGKYGNITSITPRQLCAGGESGKDSCGGDSGGPLQIVSIINGQQRYVQHGIVSYGPVLCAVGHYPGVYTRVAHYVDWILDNMQP